MSSPDSLDFDDDDTGKIGLAAKQARDTPSDPGGALRELVVRSMAHEWWDRIRFGVLAAAVTSLMTLGGWLVVHVQAEERESATTRAQLDDVRDRLVRIEAQIDRLMERSEGR